MKRLFTPRYTCKENTDNVSQMKERELRASFEKAYDEHMEAVFRYFMYRLGNRDRAKDLTQETFMRVWKYAVGGGTIRAIKPFLFTTAANLFKNELRDRKPVASLDELMEGGMEFDGETVSLEDRAEARLLFGKLQHLSESHRDVLLLRFVDQLSAREIADALGQSETAVAVRIHRALKKLRTLYEHHA